MPLRDDLLNPIEGENPSGANMRYAPVFDKIKEARREDDDAPQGEWQHERKTADYKTVLKLAQETLATKTKDIQLAAWITEALLKTEGFSGLRLGLELIRGLLETFWDTLYPEVEDGDAELRAAPIEWAGTKLDVAIRQTALTRTLSFIDYKLSRSIGYEADAVDENKSRLRAEAIADGKPTAEDWDRDAATVPIERWEAIVAALDGCLESIDALQQIAEGKFGDYPPTFGPMRTALEEVRHMTGLILRQRQEAEGRSPVAAEAEPEEASDGWGSSSESSAEAAAPARRKASGSIEPQDDDDAAQRLAAVARFLRQQDAYNPAPYLLLRGYRWGELRRHGTSPDPTVLLPPPTEIRQGVKRLALEQNYTELLEMAETAMAQPCGRAWLDLQRYVVRACDEYGYTNIAEAIRSELRALLRDIPDLPTLTLMDDTPTANAETQAWLKSFQQEAAPAADEMAAPSFIDEARPEPTAPGVPEAPDTFTLAMAAARQGRTSDAIQMLAEDIPRQHSGRSRFQRRLQLAQICMMSGHKALARPILEEVVSSIDDHRLDEWEAADVIAHPLAMLYQCLDSDGDVELRRKLYARISRLDPMRALECAR